MVITAADYYRSRDEILIAQAARVENTVNEAVRDIEVRLAVLEESTELLAEVIQTRENTRDELLILLKEAVDDREDLFGAALAVAPRFLEDPQRGFAHYFFYDHGQLTYRDLSKNYDYTLNSWYREPRSHRRAVWTEPYIDSASGDTAMVTYAVPLFRELEGEQVFYGVVTADILLDELEVYLSRMELGSRGAGFLLSRSGKVLASPRRENWLKPWARVIKNPSEAEFWGDLINAVTAEGVTRSARVRCLGVDDDCVVKLAPLSVTRWPVGAYYSEHEILQPLRDYLFKSVASQLATMALLLIGIIWVSRRVTHPLRSLATATTDIATGNFQTPLPSTPKKDEVGRLVLAFSAMQHNLQHYVEELQQETATRNRLQGELEAATAIQMSMLPAGGNARRIEDSFKLWAVLRPAKSVGGDMYTFQQQRNQRLFIAVGDVSDKGVPAALFMARAMTLLQQYVYTALDAGDIMAQLNEELLEGNDNCMFVTLFIGWLDLQSLELSFASGGHTAPTLARDGAAYSLSQETGPALGLAEDQQFPTNHIALTPGDVLAVFTDGIDEAFNSEGKQFGLNALNEVLVAQSGNSLEAQGKAILQAVSAHQGEEPQSDDITLMLIEPRAPGSARTRIILQDDAGAVSTLQAWMAQLLEEVEVSASLQNDMMLVAEEVVTNIFKYAELQSDDGVSLDIHIDTAQIRMTFIDKGMAFDPIAEAQRSRLGQDTEDAVVGGLGVHLLESLTDEQHYQRSNNENQLTLVKYKND